MRSVSGRCSETMSLVASRSGSGRHPGWPSSRVLVCRTSAPIAVTIVSTRLAMLPYPISPTVQLPMSRTVSPSVGSDGQPAPALVSRIEGGQPAQRGEHQQHGTLGDRRGVGAGHVGHADAASRGGLDVDRVHPRAQLVHQLALLRPLEVVARQRAQDVPDHLGLGQFAVEGVVVVLGAEPDVQPIGMRRKECPTLSPGRSGQGRDGHVIVSSAPPLGDPPRHHIGLFTARTRGGEVVVGVDRAQRLVGAGQRVVRCVARRTDTPRCPARR